MTTTKTTAKTPDQLQVGDRVKFGKDDFRTIERFDEQRWGARWMVFDQATIPPRAFWACDTRSRKTWRVAA